MRHVTSVHSRVCRERSTPRAIRSRVRGSSPRVQGTPWLHSGLRFSSRFIPACAGNAHAYSRIISSPYGSSPRVQGTLYRRLRNSISHRFIPACAGNAWSPRLLHCPSPVHPRVCRERSSSETAAASPGGSSPRVQGTLRQLRFRWPTCRFIPACAGNANRPFQSRSQFAVHPRVCRERGLVHDEVALRRGSSPRVQGTRWSTFRPRLYSRFIPACAGNAVALADSWLASSVHPRVCRERSSMLCPCL